MSVVSRHKYRQTDRQTEAGAMDEHHQAVSGTRGGGGGAWSYDRNIESHFAITSRKVN